jgi:hypothetical protein
VGDQGRPNGLASGTVVVGEQLIGHSDLTRTAYYNDFAKDYDITRCIAGMIEVEPHILSLVSINGGDRRVPFGVDDAALLSRLMPHLLRALQIHRRLVTAEASAADSLTVLDRLSHGVILLDGRGQVMFAIVVPATSCELAMD